MTEQNHQKLIVEYQQAVRTRVRLRRSLMGVAFGAFILFGIMLWDAGKGFASHGLNTVKQEVTDQIQANSNQYTNSLSNAAENVLAAYKAAAFVQVQRDLPKFEAITQRELNTLNKFTQERWKDFEKELLAMSKDHASIVDEEMRKIVAPERAKQILEKYGDEMNGRFENFVKTSFGDHVRVGEEIAANLNHISELEPDIGHPVSIHHSLGLLLELAGIEFQEIDNL